MIPSTYSTHRIISISDLSAIMIYRIYIYMHSATSASIAPVSVSS